MSGAALAGTQSAWGHSQEAEIKGCPGGRTEVSNRAGCFSAVFAGNDPPPARDVFSWTLAEKSSKAICKGSWCRSMSAQKPNEVQLICYQYQFIHSFMPEPVRAKGPSLPSGAHGTMEPGRLGAQPHASVTRATWEKAKQPKQGEWELAEERPASSYHEGSRRV